MGALIWLDHATKYYVRLGFQKFCLDIHLATLKLVPAILLHTNHRKKKCITFILARRRMLFNYH